MDEFSYKLFEDLEFYKRYAAIVETHDTLKKMDNPSHSEIFQEFENNGYSVKYSSKEKFFGVSESIGDFEFVFNLIFIYGRIEPIIFAKHSISNEKFGGLTMRICKQIDRRRGIDRPKSLGAPSFNNYIDMKKIMSSLFNLYEDFKNKLSEDYVLND